MKPLLAADIPDDRHQRLAEALAAIQAPTFHESRITSAS
jgi:hypothetical protein